MVSDMAAFWKMWINLMPSSFVKSLSLSGFLLRIEKNGRRKLVIKDSYMERRCQHVPFQQQNMDDT